MFVFAHNTSCFSCESYLNREAFVRISIGPRLRNSNFYSRELTEYCGFADPTINVTAIVSDLETIALDRFYEV